MVKFARACQPQRPLPTERAVVVATRPYGSAELRSILDGHGVAAIECQPDDAWELILTEQQPGLIVLVIDPALPEESRFITRLANWTHAWLVVIAPRRKLAAAALSAGGDVCLKERDSHLAAQIGALLRRSRSAGDGYRSYKESIQVGSMTVDLRTASAMLGDRPLALSPQEFRLLAALAMHPESFLSTLVLMARASVNPATPAQALNRCKTHIRNLRKKLHQASADVEIIQRRGYGYALVQKASGK